MLPSRCPPGPLPVPPTTPGDQARPCRCCLVPGVPAGGLQKPVRQFCRAEKPRCQLCGMENPRASSAHAGLPCASFAGQKSRHAGFARAAANGATASPGALAPRLSCMSPQHRVARTALPGPRHPPRPRSRTQCQCCAPVLTSQAGTLRRIPAGGEPVDIAGRLPPGHLAPGVRQPQVQWLLLLRGRGQWEWGWGGPGPRSLQV